MTLVDPTGGLGYAFGQKLPSTHMTTIATQQPFALDIINGGTYVNTGALDVTYSAASSVTHNADHTVVVNANKQFAVAADIASTIDIALPLLQLLDNSTATTIAFQGDANINFNGVTGLSFAGVSTNLSFTGPTVLDFLDTLDATVANTATLNFDGVLNITTLTDANVAIGGDLTAIITGLTSIDYTDDAIFTFSQTASYYFDNICVAYFTGFATADFANALYVTIEKGTAPVYGAQIVSNDPIRIADTSALGNVQHILQSRLRIESSAGVGGGQLYVDGTISAFSNIVSQGYVFGATLRHNVAPSVVVTDPAGGFHSITYAYSRFDFTPAVAGRELRTPVAPAGTILFVSMRNGSGVNTVAITKPLAPYSQIGSFNVSNQGAVVICYWADNEPRIVSASGGVTTTYGTWP